MPATQIVSNYKELWRIEDAFGEMKGLLKSRPMLHWIDQRIIGHLILCFLSHFCEAHLAKRLSESGVLHSSKAVDNKIIKERPLTAKQAMEELNQAMAMPVQIKRGTIWLRTDIPPNAIATQNNWHAGAAQNHAAKIIKCSGTNSFSVLLVAKI